MLRWKTDILAALKAKGEGFVSLKESGKISQHSLVQMHHGNVNVKMHTLDALCEILGCQPGDLLEYVEEP